MVNTIQKVDKLLSEKPKKKSVMVPLSKEEMSLLRECFKSVNRTLFEKCTNEDINWHRTIQPYQDLWDKLCKYQDKLG
jgi:hypothetical protein